MAMQDRTTWGTHRPLQRPHALDDSVVEDKQLVKTRGNLAAEGDAGSGCIVSHLKARRLWSPYFGGFSFAACSATKARTRFIHDAGH